MSKPIIRNYPSPRAVAAAALHLQGSKLTGLVHVGPPAEHWMVYIDGQFVEQYGTLKAAKRALRRPGRRTRIAHRLFLWLADRGVLGDLASRALRRAAYELGVR